MINKNDLYKYIQGKNSINSIISTLSKDDISTDMEIDIINSLADFIKNNLQYEHLESFNKLADVVVNIIEDFNNESIDLSIGKKNRVDSLVKNLSNLKKDIDNIKVNLSTDNRTVSNINLTEEFQNVHNTFNIDFEDYKKIYLNSVEASFCSEELKEKLKLYITI